MRARAHGPYRIRVEVLSAEGVEELVLLSAAPMIYSGKLHRLAFHEQLLSHEDPTRGRLLRTKVSLTQSLASIGDRVLTIPYSSKNEIFSFIVRLLVKAKQDVLPDIKS